ncbi:unnamed protein product, partial [Closterium sp. NIES-53]
DVGSNSLTGSILDSISALTALDFLDLSNNSLTGSIPNSISALTALTLLNLRSNSLMGSIPDSISALTALEYLSEAYWVCSTCVLPCPLGAACHGSWEQQSHGFHSRQHLCAHGTRIP